MNLSFCELSGLCFCSVTLAFDASSAPGLDLYLGAGVVKMMPAQLIIVWLPQAPIQALLPDHLPSLLQHHLAQCHMWKLLATVRTPLMYTGAVLRTCISFSTGCFSTDGSPSSSYPLKECQGDCDDDDDVSDHRHHYLPTVEVRLSLMFCLCFPVCVWVVLFATHKV